MKPILFAFLLTISVSTASAQDAGPTQGTPEAGFRPMTGPQRESVPGGALLVGAYGAAWMLVAAYLVHLGRLSSRTAADVARLQKALESRSPKA